MVGFGCVDFDSSGRDHMPQAGYFGIWDILAGVSVGL